MTQSASLEPRLHIDDLPIPMDVRPNRYWTEAMLEMAAHIGPYATLLIVDRCGGNKPYIPLDASISWLTALIGVEKAEIMSRIYGREEVMIPVAGAALRHARRAGILAAVRAKKMSLTEASRIRGMGSRTYVSHLVNHSDEGETAIPMVPQKPADARQLVMFDE